MLPLGGRRTLVPTRIFFAGGISPSMVAQGLGSAGGNALSLMNAPYRRKLQYTSGSTTGVGTPTGTSVAATASTASGGGIEYDDTTEIIDASDDPAVIAACTDYQSTAHTLCETNGYENAVRLIL